MQKQLIWGSVLTVALGLTAPIMAAAAPVKAVKATKPAAVKPAEVMSVDDTFEFFAKEAEVTTASRRAQKKSDSPVAIDVITREDIDASGAINIWDLLRFRVGVDVSEETSIEGNAVQLNVRGLPVSSRRACKC